MICATSGLGATVREEKRQEPEEEEETMRTERQKKNGKCRKNSTVQIKFIQTFPPTKYCDKDCFLYQKDVLMFVG